MYDDCSLCEALEVTEAEQTLARREGIYLDHRCRKYNKRVLHGVTVLPRDSKHIPRIMPCKECKADNNRED